MNDRPFPPNPYVIGVPLTGPAGFYGRQDIFLFIDEILGTEQQNVVVLYGQRRVGKTSLLHQITRRLKEKNQVVAIYFDLQGHEQKLLGEVLYALARTIANTLELPPYPADSFDDRGAFFQSSFLPAVYEKLGQRRLLLLFDEFDVLGDELSRAASASETLFPYLNDLIVKQRQIAFIFVVGRRIEELTTHFQSVFKQAAYRRIGLLKAENARSVIVEPVKEVLTYEQGALEAILGLTTGHPYFTQLICFEAFNEMKARQQRLVTREDILGLVDQAIESGHGALNWFWDGLPRPERFIMASVAHVTDASGLATQDDIRQILERYRIVLTGLELKDAPDRLVEWEMLRREDTHSYRFVVEMVRRWILRNHPLESARRDIDLISVRATRMYENARDAHTAGDLAFARDEYLRSLTVNPNHSGAQLGLAQVLFELGELDEAINQFEKAYQIDEVSARDGLVRARQEKGARLEAEQRAEEALSQYELAYRLAPNDETTCRRLAAIWRKRGDAALAASGLAASRELYQKALSYETGAATVEKIRVRLSHYGENETGEVGDETAEQAVELMQFLGVLPAEEANQRLVAILLKRGQQALEAGETGKAEAAHRKILRLDPGRANLNAIQKRLGETIKAAEASQDYAGAERGLESLRRLFPNSEPAQRIEIAFWTRRGDGLAKSGDKAAAIQAYQKALEMKPDDPAITARLEQVSAEWEKLLSTDQLFNRALVAHQDQAWPAAKAGWLELIKMDVLEYKGRNIAALLAEAAHPPTPEDRWPEAVAAEDAQAAAEGAAAPDQLAASRQAHPRARAIGWLAGAGVYLVALGVVGAVSIGFAENADGFLAVLIIIVFLVAGILLSYRLYARTTAVVRARLGMPDRADVLTSTPRRWTAKGLSAGLGTFILVTSVLGVGLSAILVAWFDNVYMDEITGGFIIVYSLSLPVILAYRLGLRAADRVMGGQTTIQTVSTASPAGSQPAPAGDLIPAPVSQTSTNWLEQNPGIASWLAGAGVFLGVFGALVGLLIALFYDPLDYGEPAALLLSGLLLIPVSILAHRWGARVSAGVRARLGSEEPADSLLFRQRTWKPITRMTGLVVFFLITSGIGILTAWVAIYIAEDSYMELVPALYLFAGAICLPVIIGYRLGLRAADYVTANNARVTAQPGAPQSTSMPSRLTGDALPIPNMPVSPRQTPPALPAGAPQWLRWTATGGGLLAGLALVLSGVLILVIIGFFLIITITDSIYDSTISTLLILALLIGSIIAIVWLFRVGVRLGNRVRAWLGQNLAGPAGAQPQENTERKMQA